MHEEKEKATQQKKDTHTQKKNNLKSQYICIYKLYSCVCLLVWEVHELSHSGHMTVGGRENNNAALLQAEWDLWLELPQIIVGWGIGLETRLNT